MARSMKYWDDWVDENDMEAMWDHPEVREEWLQAGEERGNKVHMVRDCDGNPRVTHTEMKAIAEIITRRHFKLLDVAMLCAIAEIESSRNPLAYRFDPGLREGSTGLMQTLPSTAQRLAVLGGYCAYAIKGYAPAALCRPFVSVYFGAACLKWLSTYDNETRDEEFVVRGYSGGPQNATNSSTLAYWNEYLRAKENLPNFSEVPLDLETSVPATPPSSPPATPSASPPPPLVTGNRFRSLEKAVGETTSRLAGTRKSLLRSMCCLWMNNREVE